MILLVPFPPRHNVPLFILNERGLLEATLRGVEQAWEQIWIVEVPGRSNTEIPLAFLECAGEAKEAVLLNAGRSWSGDPWVIRRELQARKD